MITIIAERPETTFDIFETVIFTNIYYINAN